MTCAEAVLDSRIVDESMKSELLSGLKVPLVGPLIAMSALPPKADICSALARAPFSWAFAWILDSREEPAAALMVG